MSDVHGGGHGADMYLAVRSARAGDIKGESVTADHQDEIVVSGWRWGVAANTDASSRSGAPARRSLGPLMVDKHFDRASTSLASALVSNDKLKSVVLTMRKAGEGQQDFIKVTLTDAYLVDMQCVADHDGNVVEHLTFTYAKAEVEYRVQLAGGQVGATSTFNVSA
jgi:type VI secretion system secreted protein Hcp